MACSDATIHADILKMESMQLTRMSLDLHHQKVLQIGGITSNVTNNTVMFLR